jgi:hypothetical protein
MKGGQFSRPHESAHTAHEHDDSQTQAESSFTLVFVRLVAGYPRRVVCGRRGVGTSALDRVDCFRAFQLAAKSALKAAQKR